MIRTTVVGSWPIPCGLKPRLTQYYRGVLGDETAHDVLQAAARIAMDEQRACGLDQIMGGEVFAPDFVHHVPARLTGLEVVQRRNHRVGIEGLGHYRIVGEIAAPRGTGHALAYRREKAIEPELDKAAVPSVLTMTLPFVLVLRTLGLEERTRARAASDSRCYVTPKGRSCFSSRFGCPSPRATATLRPGTTGSGSARS